MKVALNGQRLLIQKPAGPEIYTYNLFRALAKADRQNEYVIYFDQEPPVGYFQKLCGNSSNFTYKVLSKKVSWTQVSLAQDLFKAKPDVYFTAVHTIPIVRRPNTKMVAMVHGLEYEYSSSDRGFIWRKLISGKHEWFVSRFSDLIIVPSLVTKRAILDKGWSREEKIHVIKEGVGEYFYKRSEEEILQVRKKYNLGNSEYLLFVSTIEPRKNIPGMIRGFSAAKESLNGGKLLIAGKKGWKYEDSFEAPKKYGVKNDVLFIGRVKDKDLPILYSGAKAFISCSFQEGFGLPLLEAMACETPAIVSDIEAFKEIGQDYPAYVNPHDKNSIKNAIIKMWNQKQPEHMRKMAKEITSQFSWEKTAKNTLSAFEHVVKNT